MSITVDSNLGDHVVDLQVRHGVEEVCGIIRLLGSSSTLPKSTSILDSVIAIAIATSIISGFLRLQIF